MFLILLFLHFHSYSSFFPFPLFHLLYYIFYLSSPFLWEITKWPTKVDVSLNPNTINWNRWRHLTKVTYKLIQHKIGLDPDQMSHSVMSDLGKQCLLRPACPNIWGKILIQVLTILYQNIFCRYSLIIKAHCMIPRHWRVTKHLEKMAMFDV